MQQFNSSMKEDFEIMTLPIAAVSNRLLQALPEGELNALNVYLEEVRLESGETLYYADEQVNDVYFPEDSLISVMTIFENGGMLEQGCIGPEGILGAELFLSKTISTGEAMVRRGGRALRMKAGHFCRLLSEQPVLEKLVKEYMLVLMQQTAQTGACNCCHSINARLARLLLVYRDRAGALPIRLTQENMSEILGSARPAISEIASQLKEKGLISYTRGDIEILDRRGLEAEACECYQIIRRKYENYESLLKNKKTAAAASQYSYSMAVRQNCLAKAAANFV